MPLAGDRKFGEDEAIVGGFGRFQGESICVIGHEKGSSTESRLKHNFGMARPEGYRKAVRLMEMADRFEIPVIALVDTAGAYPGIGAEERGQAEAIARSTEACLTLGVPNVAVVLGEGGSGGAIAIATANRVLMLEHAIYSVISPEGAASILWHDTSKAQEAATNMKITAQDLMRFGVIDKIVAEPVGGAHRDPAAAIAATGEAIAERAGGAQGPQPGDDPPPAPRQIPGARAETRLTGAAAIRAFIGHYGYFARPKSRRNSALHVLQGPAPGQALGVGLPFVYHRPVDQSRGADRPLAPGVS